MSVHPCTARNAPDARCRMLRPALQYASRGWPVFPCRANKQPATPHGFKDASTERETIIAWWIADPAAMIGAPMGAASGIIAVDLDKDTAKGLDGPAAFDALAKSAGEPIRTRQHHTPRGGLHLLFTHPGEPVKNTASGIARGIDTRGDGGYIILPPSKTEAGEYRVEGDADPAPLPPWLCGLFRRKGIMAAPAANKPPWPPPTRRPIPADLAKPPPFKPPGCPPSVAAIVAAGVSEGQRNDRALAVAVQLRDEGHDRATVEGHVLTFARNCTPPLPEREALAVVASAFTRPPREPARNPNAAAHYDKRAPVFPVVPEPPRHAPDPWEPPAPLGGLSEPPATLAENNKPAVLLPGGAQSISDTGRSLGELLAKTERFFIRGGGVVKLAADPDGLQQLEGVTPAALASCFETVAYLCKPGKPDKDGNPTFESVICHEQTAKLIAASDTFRDMLPPIHVLTRCPVLIERAGRLIQVSGYDRESGILAAGKPAAAMDVADARRLLWELLDGFHFATPADRARALAALITPAIVFGGLLRGRAPVDLGEADASQTGKGYRNKLTAAIYAQTVKTVTQQRAGVGSMEESFNMALIRGANFIALDNVRGKIDSPSFESFLTEDTYHARAPYREPVEIDPRRVVIMLTSNKADVTPDLANRAACVRLLKQPDGHAFTKYPEGDILEHVRANQPRSLGAVFAIVKAWHEVGKPRTAETRHDFRPWAQTLDWITRNLLDAGPLLDGHRETQARMTNPVLNWLRDVALEVIRAKQSGVWLRASDIIELLAETDIETPGLPEHGNLTDPATRTNAQQATGRRLGLCFRAGDKLTIDGMNIERREEYDAGRFKPAKEYRFTAPPMDGQTIGSAPVPTSAAAELWLPETPEKDVSAYDPPMRPPMNPPIKSLIPPNAPDTLPKCKYSNTLTHEKGGNIFSMETHRRIGGTPAPVASEIEEGEI